MANDVRDCVGIKGFFVELWRCRPSSLGTLRKHSYDRGASTVRHPPPVHARPPNSKTPRHAFKSLSPCPFLLTTLSFPSHPLPASPHSSTLHQRDPRSALFDSYTGDRNRTASHSPAAAGRNPYSYSAGGYAGNNSGLSHYRDANGGLGAGGPGGGSFRPATPNKK